MPGPWDAFTSGVKRSISDVGQSAQVISGSSAPTPVAPEDNPAAESFGWRDLREPLAQGLPKLAYRVGESGPTLVGGVAGGILGSAAGPAGSILGGAGGAATGAALQTIGPAFAGELKKSPTDPDGAWDRAVQSSLVSAAASGASWAAFPLKAFSGPLKNLAFQAFGVQPGIGVAEQATKNVMAGKPATENLGEAYKEGAIGTAVPALGHHILKGRVGWYSGEPEAVSEAPTPAQSVATANELMAKGSVHFNTALQPGISPDLARKSMNKAIDYYTAASYELDRHQAPARAAAKEAQAVQLDQQSQAPGLSPVQAQDLRNQAQEIRADARHDLFIATLPPPLPPKPGKIKQLWLDNIAPESTSEAALKADAAMARYKSMKAQTEDSLILHGTESYRYKWNPVPWDDQKRFIHSYEENLGVPQDLAARYPWMDKAYDDYRKQFEMDYKNEIWWGSKAHYVENYFPHQWDNTERARQVFQPADMIRSMGSEWFQKARDYELVQFGEANGLKLKFDNVQSMVTDRRLAGADLQNKMEMMHTLEKMGVATPSEKALPHVLNPALVGSPYRWQEVKAPTGEKWMIAPDAQALWKNAIEDPGLWGNEGFIGDAFRKWMALKSYWVPVKLGLSLFHPVHVMHILGAGNIVRGLQETLGSGQQGWYRRMVATPEAVLHTLGDTIFAATPFVPFSGKKIMKSWATPKELQTPQDAANNKMVNESGSSAQLSEQLRTKAVKGLRDAWSKNQYLKTLGYAPLAAYEKSLGAIFDKWIPSLKMAALKREYELMLRRRPDLVTDDVNRRVAARALGKSIDNRFGEMFYGGLFWNRTLKDASIGSFLSLGWNLGFAREFGGGFFEPIARPLMGAPTPTRKLVRDVTTKTTNMFVYAMTAATINAMMTKGMSGEDATGLDYIFPRIGGLNPDGSPRRITNAFYTREVPMAAKNMQERDSIIGGLTQMLYHKMMISPFVELYNNKDYSGYSIWNENSPGWQQIQQMGMHVMSDQMSPMSVSGAKRALDLSGKPHGTADVIKQIGDRDVYMPLLGFGPAPSYASKSAFSNRLQFLFKQSVAPERKSFDVSARSKDRSDARREYMGAMQRDDDAARMAAAQKMASLGMKTREIKKLQPGGSDVYMFGRLPPEDQKSLLKTATPEEFNTFYPHMNKKAMKSDISLATLYQKYNAAGKGPPLAPWLTKTPP
jgi:hypothetical protein